MKRLAIILLTILPVAATFNTGCQKSYADLNANPNQPEHVPAPLILNGALIDFYQSPWSLTHRWNQFSCCNYNYYGNQEYNWAGVSLNYTTLKNIVKMEEEAAGTFDEVGFKAVGKLLRAFFFYNMSMRVGDLPMNEALKGLENLTPVYDTQKDIFKQCLAWLEEANNDIASLLAKSQINLINAGSRDSDIYFKGDLIKWQKVVNAMSLRILIQLSKQHGDADLNIKQKFASIIGDPTKYPLLSGMGDNMQFEYNATRNKYPTSPDNFGFDALRYNMAATHLNNLAMLKDPRTFVVAEPAPAKVQGGLAHTDYAAFVGASSGEDLADMSTGVQNGKYSMINRKRYYSTYTAEPCIQVGYPEMCFNIAEAINRGWLAGDAENWYKKGVQSSIGFYGITDGPNSVYFLEPGKSLGEFDTYSVNFDFNTYYNQASVKYAGNNATGLNQVLLQKYLSFFQNSGWEAYYNWRRTGVPAFLTGPGTGANGVVPKRWQYPTSERATNEINLLDALQRQYSGNDDINAVMWIIK